MQRCHHLFIVKFFIFLRFCFLFKATFLREIKVTLSFLIRISTNSISIELFLLILRFLFESSDVRTSVQFELRSCTERVERN